MARAHRFIQDGAGVAAILALGALAVGGEGTVIGVGVGEGLGATTFVVRAGVLRDEAVPRGAEAQAEGPRKQGGAGGAHVRAAGH